MHPPLPTGCVAWGVGAGAVGGTLASPDFSFPIRYKGPPFLTPCLGFVWGRLRREEIRKKASQLAEADIPMWVTPGSNSFDLSGPQFLRQFNGNLDNLALSLELRPQCRSHRLLVGKPGFIIYPKNTY